MAIAHRPARFSLQQLVAIAERLRAPSSTASPALLVLAGRRARFVAAVDAMAVAYQDRTARPRANLREAHQAIGRALRDIHRALDGLGRLPRSYLEATVAKDLLDTHFSTGLAFTQKCMAELVPDASARIDAMLLDPRIHAIEHEVATLVREAAAAVACAPPSSEAPPSGHLASLLREANVTLHAYARLIEEYAEIEIDRDHARHLFLEWSSPLDQSCPWRDLPTPA